MWICEQRGPVTGPNLIPSLSLQRWVSHGTPDAHAGIAFSLFSFFASGGTMGKRGATNELVDYCVPLPFIAPGAIDAVEVGIWDNSASVANLLRIGTCLWFSLISRHTASMSAGQCGTANADSSVQSDDGSITACFSGRHFGFRHLKYCLLRISTPFWSGTYLLTRGAPNPTGTGHMHQHPSSHCSAPNHAHAMQRSNMENMLGPWWRQKYYIASQKSTPRRM